MSLNESCLKLSNFHLSELLIFLPDGRNAVKLFEINISLLHKPQRESVYTRSGCRRTATHLFMSVNKKTN